MKRILLFPIILVATLASFFCNGHAQDVSITTSLDRGEIAIGEQALVTLKIRTEDLENTLLIVPPDSAIHHAEPLSFTVTDTVKIDNKVREITAEMVITSFDSTMVVIPAFGVRVKGKEVFADPLYLKVTLPKVDVNNPEKYYPIKQTWKLPYSFKEIFLIGLPWLIGIALLIGGIFLVRYLIRQHRQRLLLKPQEALLKNTITPLEKLKARLSSLSETEEPLLFYTELDHTMREYLSETTIPKALEMSTKQLLKLLAEHKALLQRFDYAKFARSYFSTEQKSIDKQEVIRIADEIYKTQNTSDAVKP